MWLRVALSSIRPARTLSLASQQIIDIDHRSIPTKSRVRPREADRREMRNMDVRRAASFFVLLAALFHGDMSLADALGRLPTG